MGLSLSLDESLCYFALDLTLPDRDPINIAWDDQSHWHPHVLRWPELETICRAVALQDEELPHPGWVVLLLHRFAPICEGDDLEMIVATLEAAWKQIGGFSDNDIATFIERIDARDAGFLWRHIDSLGWCLEQEQEDLHKSMKGLYTLRKPANIEFPFAEWSQMLRNAELTVEGSASANRDMALRRPPPSSECMPRSTREIILSIPLNEPSRSIPKMYGKLFNDTLNRILRDSHLGHSSSSSSTCEQNEDGTYSEVESSYYLSLKGDWSNNRPLLRDLLWWSQAPASVEIREGFSNRLPFDMETAPDDSASVVLQLAQISRFCWNSGFRFDRVAFTAAQRQTFQQIAREHKASAPDADGWHQFHFSDGGDVSICARRLEENADLDGATIRLQRLTPQTAALIYQLMTRNNWILLPLVLATTDETCATLSGSWPQTRIVGSSTELYEILVAGPYVWWSKSRAK